MRHILLIVATMFVNAGCSQALFVDYLDGCANIYGEGAIAPVRLEAWRIGELTSRNHHTGKPLDMLPLTLEGELSAAGIESMFLIASPGEHPYSLCTNRSQNHKFCFLKSELHAAGRVELQFTITTPEPDWEALQLVEEYWGSIDSSCHSIHKN